MVGLIDRSSYARLLSKGIILYLQHLFDRRSEVTCSSTLPSICEWTEYCFLLEIIEEICSFVANIRALFEKMCDDWGYM